MKSVYYNLFIVIVCCMPMHSKAVFKAIGKELEKGARSVQKEFEKGADTVKKEVEKVASKVKECEEMVRLGAEWAVKKAAYEAARAGLSVAQQVVMDAQKTAERSLQAAYEAAGISAQMLKVSGEMLQRGINPERVYVRGALADFQGAKLPNFQFEGMVFGKRVKTTMQIDLTNPIKMVEELVKQAF
jgi:phage-related tail protein